MKAIIILVAAALSSVLSHSVIAASSADINVVGSVAPAPCNVAIAGGSKFNFGTLHSDELHATEHNHFFQDKIITINCPAPTGLWVAFPFNNGGHLQPHGSSNATGQLNWWQHHTNSPPIGVCDPDLPPEARIKIDVGDGDLKDLAGSIRVFKGIPIHLTCPSTSY